MDNKTERSPSPKKQSNTIFSILILLGIVLTIAGPAIAWYGFYAPIRAMGESSETPTHFEVAQAASEVTQGVVPGAIMTTVGVVLIFIAILTYTLKKNESET